MVQSGNISRADLHDSVMLFAAMHLKPTFTAGDYAELTGLAALRMDEELANEILLEMVGGGLLLEVGPAVYAVVESGSVELQHPIFSEEDAA